jgi:hypothetical protein
LQGHSDGLQCDNEGLSFRDQQEDKRL